MNVLFVTYWSLNDGLTASTVLPHLKILERNNKIGKIVLCTIERDAALVESQLTDKVFHIPWNSSHRYSSKVKDFTILPNKIIQAIKRFAIQFVFCRGTPAGAIGYLVHRKIGIRYAVESFEPHADYMRESHVWGRWDPRYILQQYWEKRQLQTARYVLPVTENYCDFLTGGKVDGRKVFMMPCAVNVQAFAFSVASRELTRKAMGLADDVIVGIYVGKFGGMYFDSEAFHIFMLAKKCLNNFFLIVLSPDKSDSITSQLANVGFLPNEYFVKHVAHSEVPKYLSASDFAFATYKPGYFKRYLSPVKVGEYWAAGLPVLLTDGIGDDHRIARKWRLGAVFRYDESELQNAFLEVRALLREGRVSISERIQPFAVKYRNFSRHELIYNTIIDSLC